MSDGPRKRKKNKRNGRKGGSASAQERGETSAPARQALSPEEVLREGLPGATIETLKALGLLTAKGGASPHSNRKLKQIKHFMQLIAPALEDCFARHEDPLLIDAGAGRAALSLAIYDQWIRPRGRGKLIAIEGRSALSERVRAVTEAAGYDRFEMKEARILDAELPERVHFTLALHACDTATDEAILRGLAHQSDHIALVPCCQAELARLLGEISGPLAPLWRRRWHRREFGAQLINVLRAQLLQARGYAITVTELAGWEHSLKNELILGRRVARYHAGAKRELEALLTELPVCPWLLDAVAALDAGAPIPRPGEAT